MITSKVLYNAIALNYIAKNAEMKADFAKLSNESVDKTLNMTVGDFLRTNSNEVMNTGASGYGEERVQNEVLVAELLDRIENSQSLLSFATRGFADANDIIFPVKGKRARMIVLSENTDQPQNKTLTAKQTKRLSTPTVTIHSKEFIITVYASDKLMRQSVVGLANYIMDEIFYAYDNTAHQVILNGDTVTTTNNNINAIDGAVSTLVGGADSDLLAFDGARKLAFSNNATIDASGVFDLSLIRQARQMLGIKGLNPADLKLVVSQGAYFDMLGLSQVETVEKFGNSATIKEGVLSAIDGIEIINRQELGLTTANGKIKTQTLADNKYDQMVLIHTPSLLYGNTYGLTLEQSRYAEEKTTGFTGSIGSAFGWDNTQNNELATSPTALIYNIDITATS